MSADAKQNRPAIASCGSELASDGAARASPVRGSAVAAGGVPSVGVLVSRAQDGDKCAWDQLVERFAPLIWSVCRRHELGRPDADDVAQVVWLRLVDQLALVRDPAALAGWIATTTRRECGRVLRAAGKPPTTRHPRGALDPPQPGTALAGPDLLRIERHTALREAFTQLPPDCQQLIALLIQQPPVPAAQISARLGIPVGSLARRRGRCLEKLRRRPALAALSVPPHSSAGSGPGPGRGGATWCQVDGSVGG
jgi:RNA polymerase sigma factor (sigma-70 family)